MRDVENYATDQPQRAARVTGSWARGGAPDEPNGKGGGAVAAPPWDPAQASAALINKPSSQSPTIRRRLLKAPPRSRTLLESLYAAN